MKNGAGFQAEHHPAFWAVLAILTAMFSLASCGGSVDLPQSITLTTTANSPSEAQLNWTADPTPGVIGYDIYRNGVLIFPAHFPGTSYTDAGLVAGTSYCYKVYSIVAPVRTNSQSNQACITALPYAAGWTFTNVASGLWPDFAMRAAALEGHAVFRQANGVHHAFSIGGVWNLEPVVASVGASGQTTIALDSNGKVHISYGNSLIGGIFHATNASGAWVTESVDSNGAPTITALTVDSGDKLHIAYGPSDSRLSGVWYATNATGTWAKTLLPASGSPVRSVAIARDNMGAIHLAYAFGDGICSIGHVKYLGTFVTPTTIDSGAGCGVSMALDALQTTLHVAYRKGSQIMHASIDAALVGGVWSSELVDTLSGIGSDNVSLAVDGGNHLHLSYSDPNNDLKYANNVMGGWALSYIDKVASTSARSIVRIGNDSHAYILFEAGSTGTLRLARSP